MQSVPFPALQLEQNEPYLPAHGKMRVPVRVFASPRLPLRPQEVSGLERLAGLPNVAQVVALPDLHMKRHLETPSSVAVATRDQVALNLSSPSSGCGMALALTSLCKADLTPERLDRFYERLVQRLPLDGGAQSISSEELWAAFLQGAAGVVDRFGLHPEVVDAIDLGGQSFKGLGGVPERSELAAAFPDWFAPLAAKEFGKIGRGNHFFELQVVDEVLDEALAERWGLRPGQIAAMYHADSGVFGSLIGRFFAYRRKNTRRGRWIEARYKTVFHFSQVRTPSAFARRASYFFAPRRHTMIPAKSVEARQALLAMSAAANYAYANRLAIFAAFRDVLQEVWGQGAPALLYDLPHNTIRNEAVGGEALWVHRHNAARALPAGHADLYGPYSETGQPVLLPGLNRTSSYVCVAKPGVNESLFSVDHGAGRSALRLARPDLSGRHTTRLYDYGRGYVSAEPHLTDDGINEVLSVLSSANLACPVVRLRPLAVLKDKPQ